MLVLGRASLSGLKNKKGLSNLIAYVLLISITLSLSVMVYGWLKFFVGGAEVAECPGNVNIIIDSYTCYDGSFGNLTVTIKNKGLFDIDGYVLRVHDREDAEFGIYVFNGSGSLLSPGEKVTSTYVFNEMLDTVDDVTLADVQPFLNVSGKTVSCKSYSSQRIKCV